MFGYMGFRGPTCNNVLIEKGATILLKDFDICNFNNFNDYDSPIIKHMSDIPVNAFKTFSSIDLQRALTLSSMSIFGVKYVFEPTFAYVKTLNKFKFKSENDEMVSSFIVLETYTFEEMLKCCNGRYVDTDGRQLWYQDGKLHRDDDLPAVIRSDGTKEWYQHGILHRCNDMPTIEYANGDCEWYAHSTLEFRYYYALPNKSLLHRDNDLPAVTRMDDTQEWFQHGRLHRTNGPAVIRHAFKGWYVEGQIYRNDGGPALIANGVETWFQHGLKHRDNDLPAIIFPNGVMHWYQIGMLHRDHDMPAIVHPDGTQMWYVNGKFIKDNVNAIMF